MSDPFKIERMTSRPQFLAAAKGVSEARGAGVVQRLREAARAATPLLAVPGSDYVFIARMGTVDRPWDRLLDDVKSALTRLATQGAPGRGPAPKTAPTTTVTAGQDS